MTAHWYFESAPDVWTEITDRIGRVDWEVSERAEEGAADMSTLVIDDPDGDFDIRGRIYVYCEEDSSEADDDRLYGGIVVEQEIGRGGGEWLNPLGRVWTVSLVDVNTNWGRRVMVGADTDRPAETDVERVQWLMTTTETNWATDRTTWISTADPKDMDANKYLGSTVAQIMDDCAQPAAGESGSKNWYTKLIRDENGDPQIRVWYGRDTLEVYDSPLSLSNDQDDWDDDELEDGTSLVWPISMDTKLRRDPTRVYSGVYEEYDGGAVYRMDQDTIDEFSPWDFVAPNLSVKSKAKAIARAEGYLAELDEQDLIVHTTVELPAAKATMIRAGMRIQFKATHLPGFETDFVWCRVLTCSIKPVAAGERYQLTLELSPGVLLRTVGTGVMWGPENLHLGGQPIEWRATGDVHGPGYEEEPLDLDAFAYALDSGYTVGFEVVCESAVLDFDIYFTNAWAHTGHPDVTETAVLLRNGSVVSSFVHVEPATGEFGYVSSSFQWSPTGITAVNGDVFTVGFSTTFVMGATVPSGTGQAEFFRILDTSVVSL